MPIWDDTLTIKLPYTNAAVCYERLKQFPEIETAFYDIILPLATEAGKIADRVKKMEAAREKAFKDYLDSGRSLREGDTALNCCMGDLYIGMFSTAGDHIQASNLSLKDKLEGIKALRRAAALGMAWNPTKKIELDMLLDGAGAEIEEGA